MYNIFKISKTYNINWINQGEKYARLLANKDLVKSTYYQILLPSIMQLVLEYSSKEDNIIDIGCGEGYLTRELYKYRPNILGIDLSSKLINIAKKRI